MRDTSSFDRGFKKKVFEGYLELKSWILKKFLKDTQSLNRGLKKIRILWALIVDLKKIFEGYSKFKSWISKKFLKDIQSLNRGKKLFKG